MTLLTCALPLLSSLAGNNLRVEGCKVVAAVLDKTQITSLKCASHRSQCLNFAWTLCLCMALRQQPLTRCAP